LLHPLIIIRADLFKQSFKNRASLCPLGAEFMTDEVEQEILATVRTLLALERNYLAEERTELAEFRTGLAILLIVPPVSTVIAYFSSFLEAAYFLFFNMLNFTLLAVLAVWGVWTMISSHSKLSRIRKNKTVVKSRQCEFVGKSKTIHGLVGECILLEGNNEES
jgi:uncharacterized membrane protein YidH (DUF202 family)